MWHHAHRSCVLAPRLLCCELTTRRSKQPSRRVDTDFQQTPAYSFVARLQPAFGPVIHGLQVSEDPTTGPHLCVKPTVSGEGDHRWHVLHTHPTLYTMVLALFQ